MAGCSSDDLTPGGTGEVEAPSLDGLMGPCNDDSECSFTCTTDYCGGCLCDAAAILTAEVGTLQARKDALASQCIGEQLMCGVWPSPPAAMCSQGTCWLDFQMASSEFDTSCEADADCVIVHTDPCNTLCPCGGEAIAEAALGAWNERAEELRFYCPMSTEEVADFCATAGMCPISPGAECIEGACRPLLTTE